MKLEAPRVLGASVKPAPEDAAHTNEGEATCVDYLMEAFLQEGTIAGACASLNRAGYRTKAYTSRRGVYHAPGEFSFSTAQMMLKNPAYIGKKRIDDRLIDAVWPALVDEEKFGRVQALLAASARSKRSVVKAVRHVYVLNGGLLHCGCGSAMEGRSGTGRGGVVYFYYACRLKACGLRVAADEVEGVVLEHLRRLGDDRDLVERLSAETNRRLQRSLPKLHTRRASMEKQLTRVQARRSRGSRGGRRWRTSRRAASRRRRCGRWPSSGLTSRRASRRRTCSSRRWRLRVSYSSPNARSWCG